MPGKMPLVIAMGVSGSGKSTIGLQLSQRLGVSFIDGDDLHPQANVDKMHAGRPLTDEDRWPWLARVGRALTDAEDTGVVIACSALKRSYRDAIRHTEPRAVFLHLAAPHDVIAARLAARHGHFMPPSLLDSQYATLEPLQPDEVGITVDVSGDREAIIADTVAQLQQLQTA